MATANAREKHVTVNGVRLRYLDWGTEGKMPMVCLHGHTGQAHIWDEFAEAMRDDYHVLTVDQRGHGESEWAATGYARDRFVEDLAAFADVLGLKRFTLAGLSMGGWNSILYTPDHQDRVERVIIVDIAPESNPLHMEQRGKRPPIPMDFPSLEAVLEWARGDDLPTTPAIRRRGVLEWARGDDPWATDTRLRQDTEDKTCRRDDGRWVWKADPALFNFVLPDMTDPAHVARYWKAFEAIQCPVLEVRGLESGLVLDETVRRMEQVGKRFRSVDVEGAGHIVPVDKPHEFIEVTRGFLGVAG